MATHPEEHGYIYQPDQRALAKALLLWQHADKPRLQALVKALAAGAQLAENTTWAVMVGATTIDGAEGRNLDRWGAIVGEFRGGLGLDDLTEELYRRFIRLRIRVNSEHPSEDAMYEVLSEAVDPSTVTSYRVADGIVYQIASEEWLDESQAVHAAALIRDFRPAAIYAPVLEYLVPRDSLFGTVAEPGALFGSIAAPGIPLLRDLHYSGRSRS